MTDNHKPLEPDPDYCHKGERCVYTGKICQEDGSCKGCQIWLNHLNPKK